jgi:hypothetical protein
VRRNQRVDTDFFGELQNTLQIHNEQYSLTAWRILTLCHFLAAGGKVSWAGAIGRQADAAFALESFEPAVFGIFPAAPENLNRI